MQQEKLSEHILLRLPPSLTKRLAAATSLQQIGRQHIIRFALTSELDRIEAKAKGVSPAEANALASFRKLTGQDPVAVLRAATKAHLAQR